MPFSATPIAFCASERQKHMVKCKVANFTLVKHSVLGARMSKTHSKMTTFAMEVLKTHSKMYTFSMKIKENLNIPKYTQEDMLHF